MGSSLASGTLRRLGPRCEDALPAAAAVVAAAGAAGEEGVRMKRRHWLQPIVEYAGDSTRDMASRCCLVVVAEVCDRVAGPAVVAGRGAKRRTQ